MDDCRDSTLSPPAHFAPLRESFLQHVTEPHIAAGMRLISGAFYEMVLEFCRYWPVPEESTTRCDLRAAAADLRHVVGCLRGAVAEAEASTIPASDGALAQRADSWAAGLASIADEIEQALAV